MNDKFQCVSCGRKIRKELIPAEYPKISDLYIDCPWCNGADEHPTTTKAGDNDGTIY